MYKYIFCLLAVLVVSCDSSTGPDANKPDSEFIPLKVGNFWEYEESYTSEDTSYTENYTFTITKTEEIGGFLWFKLESKTGERFLMSEENNVYELQYNRQTPVHSLEYIMPSEKEESFNSLQGGDAGKTKTVEKLDTTINTKMGKFDNCLKYEFSSPDFTVIEILTPEVGIVKRQITSYTLDGEQTYQRVAKIVDAKIE